VEIGGLTEQELNILIGLLKMKKAWKLSQLRCQKKTDRQAGRNLFLFIKNIECKNWNDFAVLRKGSVSS